MVLGTVFNKMYIKSLYNSKLIKKKKNKRTSIQVSKKQYTDGALATKRARTLCSGLPERQNRKWSRGGQSPGRTENQLRSHPCRELPATSPPQLWEKSHVQEQWCGGGSLPQCTECCRACYKGGHPCGRLKEGQPLAAQATPRHAAVACTHTPREMWI